MRNLTRSLGVAAIYALTANAGIAQEAPVDEQAPVDRQGPADQQNAAENIDAPLSLLDIYQRALRNDPTIREAEATYLAAAEALPQARSFLLPTLNLSAGLSSRYSENPFGVTRNTGELVGLGSTTDSDSNDWGVSLNQTVFDWGQFTQLKQAEKIVTQAETDYAAAQQDLVIRVAETYFNVLAAEDALAAAVAARESIARQLEQAERRYEVGLIAITDVQEAQAGFDSAVADVIAAEQVLATNREFLREIIGDYVVDIAGPDQELPLTPPDPASADQWVRRALQQNLNLISSRIGADIAQDDISIQRSARLPTLSLSANYSDSSSERLQTVLLRNSVTGLVEEQLNASRGAPSGYSWSLNLQVPLFTGGLNSSRIQQSVYQHRAALEALERVQRQTERETRDAYLSVISDISRVRALARAVESNRTALRAAEAGFEVGTRTTVDVLTAQNNLRQAETTYARARYDYIFNTLRLKQAAGGLGVEDVRQVDTWLE